MIITKLLTLVNQLKIYHWQTKSYAQHIAFEKIYNSLSELIDDYIEIFIGKNGTIQSKEGFNFKLNNIDNSNISSFIDDYCSFFTTEFVKNLNKDTDTDLFNIRDEMLAQLNKLKYLLTLK